MKIYFNGKIVSAGEANLSLFDRGFLYGDGVFESLRTYKGKIFLLEDHLKRLLKGAKLLKIKGLPSLKKLKLAAQQTLKANNLKEAYLKVIITRGVAKSHGLEARKSSSKPTIIILAEKLTPYPQKVFTQGWKAIISSVIRPNTPSSRLKTLCYVDNILAKMEAQKNGANEAFMLDEKGNIAEGTISNIFMIKFGILYTPPEASNLLPGITRRLVIKLAKQSAFKVVEKILTPKDLYTADECFITFSGAGIIPIVRLWKRKVGSGKPGYLTSALIKRYDAETEKL